MYLDSACILTAIFFVEHLESNTKVPVEKCSFLDINVVKKTTPLAIIHLTKGSEKSVESFFLFTKELSASKLLTLRLSSVLL